MLTSDDLRWISSNGRWYPFGSVMSATSTYPGINISTNVVKEIPIWD